MFKDKDTMSAIIQYGRELDDLREHSKKFITANAHIEAMIKHKLVSIDEFQEHCTDLITASSEIAFMIGLQTGARLVNDLIIGSPVRDFMRTFDDHTDYKRMIEADVDRKYHDRNEVKTNG